MIKTKSNQKAIFVVTYANYDPAKSDDYTKKFLQPIIAASFRRLYKATTGQLSEPDVRTSQ